MAETNLTENLISALGLESLPEERRVAMVNRMADIVQKRVILRIMDSLSEEDAVEAEKLANDPEKLLGFLMTRVDDIGALLAHEVDRLRNELVSEAGVEPPVQE